MREGVSPEAQAFGYLREKGLPWELGADWAAQAQAGQRQLLGAGGTRVSARSGSCGCRSCR
ncbi:MAG: hypothetical protein M5U26_03480 [Planctomycetota bacterium]|nr:hypothetical protein [Planctomycetota bacterium]